MLSGGVGPVATASCTSVAAPCSSDHQVGRLIGEVCRDRHLAAGPTSIRNDGSAPYRRTRTRHMRGLEVAPVPWTLSTEPGQHHVSTQLRGNTSQLHRHKEDRPERTRQKWSRLVTASETDGEVERRVADGGYRDLRLGHCLPIARRSTKRQGEPPASCPVLTARIEPGSLPFPGAQTPPGAPGGRR